MFISNKEKNDINENIIRNKSQIDNVVKHVAKLQVDMGSSGIPNIANIQATVGQVQKMCWGAKDEMKKMQEQVKLLREINDLIIKRLAETELLAKARSQIIIPHEEVQEKKGVVTVRTALQRETSSLFAFIQETKKAEEQKQRNRESKRKYYLKKKAEKAAQQSLL